MKTNEKPGISIARLMLQIVMRFIFVFALISAMLFIPAGDLKYKNAWIFIGALFFSMIFVLVYLIIKDPELLQKRLRTKEKEKTQKVYLIFSTVAFIVIFVVSGLDYRFQWSNVSSEVVIWATLIMIVGYFLFFSVMLQNRYASRVIEIQENQKVIDTGFYSYIRHPMYILGIIYFIPMPLVLGSVYAFIPVLFIPVLLVIRILNEEKVLIENLDGYKEYMKKVKYRLIPYIW